MVYDDKISVIIPVYNVETMLRHCLDSVVMQSYSNLEIILIDDGSSDKSGIICNEYASRDKRITVVHKKNNGQASARNDGLLLATGSYLSFVDSDDILNKSYYEEMMTIMKNNNADIVSCQFVKFYDYNQIPKPSIKQSIFVYRDNKVLNEYFNPTKYNIYHNIWNKIYKKEMFENVKFTEGIVHDDLDIIHKVLNNCRVLAVTNYPYYYYFKKNPNSITNNFNFMHIKYSYEPIKEMLSTYINRGDIKNDLLLFCSKQLTNTYEQSFCLPNNKEVLEIRKLIKKTIRYCLVESNMSPFTKLKITIRIFLPNLHKKYALILKKV